MHGRSVHGSGYVWWGACVVGACMVGGMHGRGCVAGGHACMVGEMATAADGTHPAGIHSCHK